jgi:hypothetical protein
MGDTIRKRIFQNLEQTLLGVNDIREVLFGTFEPDHEKLPVCGIIPADDPRDELNAPRVDFRHLHVAIRTIVDQTHQNAGWEYEDLEGIIRVALLADKMRGGLAQDTRVLGTKYLYNDAQFPQAGGELLLEIDYKTAENDPSVLG